MPGVRKRKRRRRPQADVYEDPFQALIDRVLDTQQARDLFDYARKQLDRAGNAIDPAAQPLPPLTPPPPPRRRRPNKTFIARTIMHFEPTEILTRDLITKRRRALAELCHPDKGGNPEAMIKINQAADILLHALK